VGVFVVVVVVVVVLRLDTGKLLVCFRNVAAFQV